MLYYQVTFAAFGAFASSSYPSLHIIHSTNAFKPGVLFGSPGQHLCWAPPPGCEGGTQLEVIRVLGGPPGLETLVPVPGHDPLLGGHGAEIHAFQPRQCVDDVRPAGGSDTAA